MDVDDLIAQAVRVEMARQRVSGRRMQSVLGISQAAWSRRVNGEVPFTGGELYEVALALGVPVASLYPPEPEPIHPVEAAVTRRYPPVISLAA